MLLKRKGVSSLDPIKEIVKEYADNLGDDESTTHANKANVYALLESV